MQLYRIYSLVILSEISGGKYLKEHLLKKGHGFRPLTIMIVFQMFWVK